MIPIVIYVKNAIFIICRGQFLHEEGVKIKNVPRKHCSDCPKEHESAKNFEKFFENFEIFFFKWGVYSY